MLFRSGHNVITGLFDQIKRLNPENRLFGFILGPGGFVDHNYKELTKEVIDEYRNTGGFDMIGSGRTKLEKVDRHNEHTLNSLPKEITYCGHPTKEEFLEKTRTYVSQLMEAANPQNAPMLMVDQLVPPSEIWRYLPFFDDIRVIVVDRDPRDLYILEKFRWR